MKAIPALTQPQQTLHPTKLKRIQQAPQAQRTRQRLIQLNPQSSTKSRPVSSSSMDSVSDLKTGLSATRKTKFCPISLQSKVSMSGSGPHEEPASRNIVTTQSSILFLTLPHTGTTRLTRSPNMTSRRWSTTYWRILPQKRSIISGITLGHRVR
jgi:hypothetical protein